MTSPETDQGWHPVATVPDPMQARELFELLEAAGLAVRMQVLDAAGRAPGVEPEYDPGSWTVLVSAAEVPVAVGVAERFLPWFVTETEGELDDEECAAALDEPNEVEFAERLETERARRTRRTTLAGGAVLLFVIAVAGIALAAVVRALFG